MSNNPFQSNQNHPSRRVQRPSRIANPYASTGSGKRRGGNSLQRSGWAGNYNGSLNDPLSLMAAPLHRPLQGGEAQPPAAPIIQPPPDMMMMMTNASANTANTKTMALPPNDDSDHRHHQHSYSNGNDGADRITRERDQDDIRTDDPVNAMKIHADNANHEQRNNASSSNNSNGNSNHHHGSAGNISNAGDSNQSQVKELRKQLKALREALEAQSETNFEMNATIATMQAEMDHAIQTSEARHKEESSKLKHLLRLEQQKSKNLQLQRQRQQNQPRSPVRKRSAGESLFTKRLEAQAGMKAAPVVPDSITLRGADNRQGATPAVATGTPAPRAPQPPTRRSLLPPDDATPAAKNAGAPSSADISIAPKATVVDAPGTSALPAGSAATSTRSGASRLAQRILQFAATDVTSIESRGETLPEHEHRETEKSASRQPNSDNNAVDNNDVGNESDTNVAREESSRPEQYYRQKHHHHHHHHQQQQQQQARRVLIDIASDAQTHWSEAQLVEFVLRQEEAWELWYPTLRNSRLGRQELLQAIVIQQQHAKEMGELEEEEGNESMRVGELEGSIAERQTTRITRLGQPIDKDGKGRSDSTMQDDILRSLLDPWWDPPPSPSLVQADAVVSRGEQESDHPVDSISPSLAHEWIVLLVEAVTQKNRNQFEALRLLHVISEECNDKNDQNALWDVCHGPMLTVSEGLYFQWMLQTSKLIQKEVLENHKSDDIRRLGKSKRKVEARKRRLQAIPVQESSMEPSEIADTERTLAVALSTWNNLIASTKREQLESWFMEEPANGARMVSMVLDVLEEHGQLHEKRNRPRNPACYSIKGWYLDAIEFLSTVGTTKAGMDILRTRTHPSDGDSGLWMGNSLDVAIQQLFSLVMDQDQDTRPRSEDGVRMRALAIEGWIRLWHQVLIFVQDQQLPDKEPVQLSFRSLVLEHQDEYTNACAMLLSDPDGTREDIQTLIRLQLEELSMDEEEYEELRCR